MKYYDTAVLCLQSSLLAVTLCKSNRSRDHSTAFENKDEMLRKVLDTTNNINKKTANRKQQNSRQKTNSLDTSRLSHR